MKFTHDVIVIGAGAAGLTAAGGCAMFALSNRCFPTKVVPLWNRPFTEAHHAEIVATYFKYSAEWDEVGVFDVSPDGWTGQRDPMIVVVGRK